MTDSPRRLRCLLVGFILASTGIFARLVALEVGHGDVYRAEASKPVLRGRIIPAMRGRILARDGTVLVEDRPLAALALRYRYLEQPSDPRWLRATARAGLSSRERRQPLRVAEEEARVRDALADMHLRLAALSGMSIEAWQAQCARIQARVQERSQRVNRLHESRRSDETTGSDESWLASAGRTLFDALFKANDDPPAPITIAEELDEHVVWEGLSLEAVAEIEGHPELYRGAAVLQSSRRIYRNGSSAPHLLGYVRAARDHADRLGQAGIERQYDALLRGRDGSATDRLDRQGRTLSTTVERAPVAGRDLVLTIDAGLQRSAEAILDDALARRVSAAADPRQRDSGGAVVVMDVHSGAILAAASGPRFDPSAFAETDSAAIERFLTDPAHPLFDRTVQMAIPPGSVFKTVTAAALVHEQGFDPERPFDCQGYLNSPESRRCMIYRRFGVGHGPVTLTDALAQSCNVYFFHHAEQLGLASLVDWGRRFGFGAPAGVDLPGEAMGHLATGETSSDRRSRQREAAESLAIGQGSLTATPLQVVRMMAAIANGGQLVTPHVAARLALQALDADDPSNRGDLPEIEVAPPRSIPGLDAKKLEIVREGLRRVVADPKGTGHATVALDGIAIAGKTGTAETGDGSADHAWFAGYAPADAPRVAFVVVLEHAGDAAATAGPVAKRLAERLRDLGYLAPAKAH